jgi:hypothetical protein
VARLFRLDFRLSLLRPGMAALLALAAYEALIWAGAGPLAALAAGLVALGGGSWLLGVATPAERTTVAALVRGHVAIRRSR